MRSTRLAVALHHAARSLLAHRLRASLSALGIVCGVASFVVLICVSEGARRDTLARIGELGTRNVLVRAGTPGAGELQEARTRGSAGLSRSDAARLLHGIAGVRRVGAIRELPDSPEFGRHGMPLVASVTPDYLRILGSSIVAGRGLSDDDVVRRSPVCLVGETVARRLGRDGAPGGVMRLGDSMCRVVGVVRRSAGGRGGSPASTRDFGNAVLLPFGAEARRPGHDDAVSELLVEFESPDAVLDALPALRRTLLLAHKGVEDAQVVAPRELLEQANRAQRNFLVLTGSVAIVSLLVGGIGIMNTMLASVSQRTREIGLRRAVGATRRQVASQFLAEAALLTAAGCVGGLLVGTAASIGISAFATWPVAVTAWSFLMPAVFAMLAGIAFGVYPAMVASRMDPMEALRHS